MHNDCDKEAITSRKHWIFDLDGTLTVAVHDFKAIKEALGVPFEADILAYLDALPGGESALRHQLLDSIERDLSTKATAAPGAFELLSSLATAGCALGILTRNTHDVARISLEYAGLGDFFTNPSCIIGRHDAAPKPDPEGAWRLASLWGASPDDIVVTGDYLYDLLCGRNIGAATIHVDTEGLFRWSELADLQVLSLNEVAAMHLRNVQPHLSNMSA